MVTVTVAEYCPTAREAALLLTLREKLVVPVVPEVALVVSQAPPDVELIETV